MNELKFFRIWMTLGLTMIASVIFTSLDPHPIDLFAVKNSDKIMHLLAYFVLMLWFVQLFRRRFHWLLALAFILLGVGIEFAQEAGGHRFFSYADMVANGIGVLLAGAAGGTAASGILARVESRFTCPPPN